MGLQSALKAVWRQFAREHRDVRSFEQEVEAAGIAGRSEGGMKTIPVTKVVGSVGRAQNLRSDFFYKSGKVTSRFLRIGEAMRKGKDLPPIEVYKAKLPRQVGDGARQAPVTEYYVVDGHHRVAMAKKLGQDYLDAHVVEYRVRPPRPAGAAEETPGGSDGAPSPSTTITPPASSAAPAELPCAPAREIATAPSSGSHRG